MKTYLWLYVLCGFLYLFYSPFSDWADNSVLPLAKTFMDAEFQKIPGYVDQGRLDVMKYYGIKDDGKNND
jgi:hypothetical protein